MIKYPNGIPNQAKEKMPVKVKQASAANRGMGLESRINLSNEYYHDKNHAVITKRPTPINIVKVDYTKGARITDAYFEKQSTTDYNGVYRSRYLDFEAKSSKLKTSFPLNNIYPHQIDHLRHVLDHGGIAFFLIEFASRDEVYLLDASYIIAYFLHNERKSIPYEDIKKTGRLVPVLYHPPLDYLAVVDEMYFK